MTQTGHAFRIQKMAHRHGKDRLLHLCRPGAGIQPTAARRSPTRDTLRCMDGSELTRTHLLLNCREHATSWDVAAYFTSCPRLSSLRIPTRSANTPSRTPRRLGDGVGSALCALREAVSRVAVHLRSNETTTTYPPVRYRDTPTAQRPGNSRYSTSGKKQAGGAATARKAAHAHPHARGRRSWKAFISPSCALTASPPC
jgi:hypothetical protein